MSQVLYVGFYAEINSNPENRNCSIAAVNLMDYVAKSLSCRNGVTIVSPSWSTNTTGHYKASYKKLSDNVFLQNGPTIGFNNSIQKLIAFLLSQIWLLFYLIKNSSAQKPVVMYHSPLLYIPILISKKIRNYHLILQVSEIYQDAGRIHWLLRCAEKHLIKLADRFVLSTENLRCKYEIGTKPYCICAGVYEPEERITEPANDGVIHVVYSGVIDQIKKGAFNAVEAARFLGNTFHLHIIGFGANEDVELLKKHIDEINVSGNALVTYDGVKKGKEFHSFLQKCHIGLSTQSPESEFNNSSFPAKIYSYLANRLQVVSISIDVIQQSPVSKIISFYLHNNPRELADAIKKASSKLTAMDDSFLGELDADFKKSIVHLLFSNEFQY